MTQLSKVARLTVWISSALSMLALLMPAVANDGIAGVQVRQAWHRIPAVEPCHPSLLRAHAQTITVKIHTGNQWSSGTLIRRQGNNYTVLTNQHVLRTGTFYQVQTFDGHIYPATVRPEIEFVETDLAVLHFRSDQRYEIATLGSSLALPVGTPVFVAGFPITGLAESKPGLLFNSGQVSLVAPKVLEGGYQLGYSNIIKKGMSGGPVLNARGEVIAINGVHQAPLWGSHLFADGSQPPNHLQQTLVNSSWAIPIETFIQFSTNQP